MSYGIIMSVIRLLIEGVQESKANSATTKIELGGQGAGYVLELTYRKIKVGDFDDDDLAAKEGGG